jgi:hypothetical protein
MHFGYKERICSIAVVFPIPENPIRVKLDALDLFIETGMLVSCLT